MAAHRRKGRNDHINANSNGATNRTGPFLIGVAGGTASGKSTVCARIMEQFNQEGAGDKRVLTMSLESFYHILSEDEHIRAKKGQYNFDHPSAFDEEYLLRTLMDIKAGKDVTVSEYDKAHNCRSADKTQVISSADVILIEGILTFYFKEILPVFDMKLFVDTDADTRLSRRVLRDTKDRGRELDQVLHQYTTFVKPAFEEFCLPSKKYADVIIPRGADNEVAIDLIVQHIRDLLHPTSGPQIRLRHNSDSLFCFPNPKEKDHSYVSAH